MVTSGSRSRKEWSEMNAVVLKSVAACLSVTCLGTGALGGTSFAQTRKPAPIVFAETGQAASAPTGRLARTAPEASIVSSTPGQGGKRVEFRYPDRPDLAFSADGVRTLGEDAAPFQFSSSQAAISSEDARVMTSAGLAPASGAPFTITQEPLTLQPARAQPPGEQIASARVRELAPERAVDYAAPVRVSSGFSPVPDAGFSESGVASWYGPGFEGKPTASGEVFDPMALTGAHPTLPLPSLVEVTNAANGRRVVIRINDRGPFVGGRILDVSQKVAGLLGFEDEGEAKVALRYIGPAGQPDTAAVPRPQTLARAPEALTPTTTVAPASQPVQYDLPETDTGDFFVQTGSFADIGNARTLARQLEALGPVTIVPARVNGSDYFRVMAGPVTGRMAAEDLRDRLARSGVTGGLVRQAE
jgi:rare lipoprotein A